MTETEEYVPPFLDSDQLTRPSVPRWLVVLLWMIAGIAIIMLLAGAVIVGTTWDEQVQALQLQTYFAQGWHVTADALINGVPDPSYIFGTYVYGPVGEFLPHLVNVLLGNETFTTVSTSASAFAGRHVGTAVSSILGAIAVAGITRVVTNSWRWALLGAVVLLVTPLWLGHGMFNIKDVPAAVGYSIATLGIVLLTRLDYFTNARIRILAFSSIISGSVLAAGTRTALGLPLAATIPIAIAFMWLSARRYGPNGLHPIRSFRRLVEGVVSMAAAYLVLLLIYPNAYRDPVQLGIHAILDSANYPVSEAQLTNGQWMLQPVPWSYLPLWFAAQLPLLMLCAALFFMIVWAWESARGILLRRESHVSVEQNIAAFPVLLQASLLPVLAAIGQSTLYNGTRQMLFVVPAIAVLSTLGLERLCTYLLRLGKKNWLRAVWIVIALGISIPFIAQMRLFPYNYTFFNAVATAPGIDGRWATDYWRASGRELIQRVPLGGTESCGTEQLAKGQGVFPCLSQPMFSTYSTERGLKAKSGSLDQHQYWFIRENSGNLDLPPGCEPFDEITRQLFWERITIGQIAICDSRIDQGKRNMADPEASPN